MQTAGEYDRSGAEVERLRGLSRPTELVREEYDGVHTTPYDEYHVNRVRGTGYQIDDCVPHACMVLWNGLHAPYLPRYLTRPRYNGTIHIRTSFRSVHASLTSDRLTLAAFSVHPSSLFSPHPSLLSDPYAYPNHPSAAGCKNDRRACGSDQ